MSRRLGPGQLVANADPRGSSARLLDSMTVLLEKVAARWARPDRLTVVGRISPVTTMFVGEVPTPVQEWLDRRRALGQDGFDEVWEGVYHVAPMAHGRQGHTAAEISIILHGPARSAGLRSSSPVNIGTPFDYRVPDWVLLRGRETALWNPTAAVVVEIVSTGDESREKFGFYFRAGVEEVLIVDPAERTVEWFVRGSDRFVPAAGSALLGITAEQLHDDIDWPD